MNKIDKLLAKYCPEGVDFEKLEEIASYAKDRIRASELDEDSYVGVDNLLPEMRGKEKSSYVPTTGTCICYKSGDILIGNIRPYLMKIWLADSLGGSAQDVLTIRIAKDARGKLIPDFLYYILASHDFFSYNMSHARGTKMPRGDRKAILKYRIPIPPMAVQNEIVNILDTFSQLAAELEAELEAELQARRKQYQHYRDKLMSFEKKWGKSKERKSRIDRLLAKHCPEGVEFKSIHQLGELVRGNGISKSDFEEKGIGCIHYGQLHTHYGTWANETLSFVSPEKENQLVKVDPGDLVITNTSENVEDVCKAVAWLGKSQIVAGSDTTILKHNQNPKYLSYYLQTHKFSIEKRRHATGTKVMRVYAKNLAKIKIPIPPLEVQQEIVSILDKFDTLVNDLCDGIPAEINARRKQYEYYRDKLLTFKEAA